MLTFRNENQSCSFDSVESKCQRIAKERVYGKKSNNAATNVKNNSNAPSTSTSCSCENSTNKCRAELLKFLTPRPSTAKEECRTFEPYVSPCGFFSSNSSFKGCGLGFCPSNPSGKKRPTKTKGLGKKISSSTLHSIESVNDLRAWGICKEDKRNHFLELMNPDEVIQKTLS